MRSGGGGWVGKMLAGRGPCPCPSLDRPGKQCQDVLFSIPAPVGQADGGWKCSVLKLRFTVFRALPMCPAPLAPSGLPELATKSPKSPDGLRGGGGEGVGVCMQPDLGRELPSYSELTWSSLRTVAHSSPVFLADSTRTLFPLTFTGGPQSSPDAATK